MAISWSVELDDKVSAPANAAAAAMGSAASKARSMTDAVGSAHGPVTALADHMGNAGHGAEGMGEAVFGAEFAIEALKVGAELAVEAIKMAGEAILELGHFAIESAEGVKLLESQLGALSGGGEEAGAATLAMLRQLETEIPQSEKVVGSWARSLMAAGVTDMTKLHDSLKAVAGAEALVEGGGEKVRGVLEKLNEASQKGTKIRFNVSQLAGTGVTEEELLKNLGMTPKTFELARKNGTITGTQIADAMVKAINDKAAGPLADQMGELGTIMTKGKDAIGRIFEKVNIKPLVEGIKSFFALFDEANPSGQAIRVFVVAAFDTLFSVAGKVFAFLRVAFLQLIIWGLEAYLYMRPLIRSFEEWYAKVGGAQILMTALKGVAIVLGSLAAAAAVVAAVGLVVWATFTAGSLALLTFVAYVIGLVPKMGEALGDLAYHAVEAAKDFVMGLVNGIKAGTGLVIDAVRSMGKAAWTSIKNVLGISSPSKVMLDVGANVTAGMVQGIEAGTPDVADAGATMGAAAVPRTGRGASGGGVSFTVGDINVTVEGGHKDAHQIGEAVGDVVEERLGSLMNRLSLMSGSAPVPA